MYEKRFGLTRRPFPGAPDTSRYYPATSHETARATLQRALADDEGIVLLAGMPGTGKSLLGQVILEQLPEGHVSALLTNGHVVDRTGLFQALLYDLGLPYADRGEQVLRLRLTDQMLKSCAAGARTLLVIDEAQHLSADLLEELRLLTNLEAGGQKAVQIVLIGQPNLLDMLSQPALAALQQRIAVRCRVEPLDLEEACDYVQHHLRQAGARPEQVIDGDALEVLARGCGGIPRRLNQAGHQALLLAAAGELSCVDAEAALEALVLLGLSTEPTEMPRSDEAPSVAGTIDGMNGGRLDPPAAEPIPRPFGKLRRSA